MKNYEESGIILPDTRADQLGPWTKNITFKGGVPVGGYASLTLNRNGAYHFSGHLHDSGLPSYNVSMVWVVTDSKGTAYTFSKQGHVTGHSPFSSGSHDFNWNDSGVNHAIAAGWPALEHGWSYHRKASVHLDAGALLHDVITGIGYVAQVIAIVA
ncbi:hypothetical protein AT278_29740 [Bacillus cereus]|uniref:hypothetical protein n=1 Tax=Bacillus TaxID=1386 RepID=UPI00077A3266|nr:hypothetical protein [Bacillus cereus]KXY57733.1 hypothetical protein AT278_29740 [Bacillus cereus]MEB8944740.1 hypothetical protein [Bacillus cereus]MEB9613436.1 hypothetical protein [Bacillus cereus]PFJ90137.1 hypothetical protein COJ11_21985 [Bacillus cereus]PGR54794.1 hypothetical protein COC44_28670 [Bacillus cereus]